MNPYRSKLIDNIFFRYHLKLNTYYLVKRPALAILLLIYCLIILTDGFNLLFLMVFGLYVLLFQKIFFFYCLARGEINQAALEKQYVKLKRLYAKHPNSQTRYWCAVSSFFFAPQPDYEFSDRLLREVLREEITNLEAFSVLSDIYYTLGKREEAELAFAAVETLGGDAWASYKRGLFLLGGEAWQEAFFSFQQARKYLREKKVNNKYLPKQVMKALAEVLRVAIPYYSAFCLEHLNNFEEAQKHKQAAYKQAKWSELKSYLAKKV